tara:strand:+ start:62 stop:313 length:252 start_codon:yes stop_codon:yes gene_type:complete
MSSEIQKYNNTKELNKKNFFKADVIDFPKDKKTNYLNNFKIESDYKWKLYDENIGDDDQLGAVVAICFMFITLFLIGLVSSLT